jgi:hypothetical protein
VRAALFFAGAAIALSPLASAQAGAAVTYVYTGAPEIDHIGSQFQGKSLTFSFTTPAPLPANLSFTAGGLVSYAFQVPVTSWSGSIGGYSFGSNTVDGADGPSVGLLDLAFDTNAAGAITGWFIFANPYTSDGVHYIALISESPGAVATIFGSTTDYTQLNPLAGQFLDAGTTSAAGSWKATAAVPEPGGWALLLAGFVGLGAALRGRRTRAARPA